MFSDLAKIKLMMIRTYSAAQLNQDSEHNFIIYVYIYLYTIISLSL